jgi:two-component system LytT family sensor kinase
MTLRLQNSIFKGIDFPILLLRHSLAWMAFILYEVTSIYFATGRWGSIAVHLLYYGLNIGLFYFHASVVLYYTFGVAKSRYFGGILLLLAEMIFYLLIKSFFDRYIESFPIPLHNRHLLTSYLVLNIWRGIYFMGFATAYWSVGRLVDYRVAVAESERRQLAVLREKSEVEKDLAETRYAHLQQQISPHFIFNALNLIYSSVYRYSEVASKCVLLLSDLLRYSFAEQDVTGKTDLAREVEQLHNLIAINRLRHDFDLFVLADLPEIKEGTKIIPLVLLTFTENIFKHGNLRDKTKPAKIKLTVSDNGLLEFATWNLKKRKDDQSPYKSTGICNATKRLDYCYPGGYSLTFQNESDSYTLNLSIPL